MMAPTPATTTVKGPTNSATAAGQRSRSSTAPPQIRFRSPGHSQPLRPRASASRARLYGRLLIVATGLAQAVADQWRLSPTAPPSERFDHRRESADRQAGQHPAAVPYCALGGLPASRAEVALRFPHR